MTFQDRRWLDRLSNKASLLCIEIASLAGEQLRNNSGIRIPSPYHWWGNLSRADKLRWSRYIICSVTVNSLVWFFSIIFLVTTKPIYTSRWALILPGSISAVNLNLPEVGQASASSGATSAPTSTFDPRDNYAYIFSSEQVIRQAAKNAKIPREEFDEPRIKNIDNTTVMQFEMSGSTPEEAKRKSYALYDALRRRLNELRTSEIEQRQEPTQNILRETQAKLSAAQRKVSEYKLHSGLNSTEQVQTLSNNIEQLRRQRAEYSSQQAQAEGRVQKLRHSLGLNADEAADAFKLQVNQIFQQNLKDYSEATAILKIQLSKFGANHPRIIKEIKRQRAARQAMQWQAQQVLGRSLQINTLFRLALNNTSSGRDSLFQALVTDQSTATGAAAQVSRLDQQIRSLEARLRWMSQRQSTLENLKLDEQIAEAVLSSTLAKLDLGQADLFAAYPLVQIATEPSTADHPSFPNKGLIISGSALSSIFTTLGLWALWIRKPWIRRFANWASS